MTLGQKLARLRALEGFARGLDRELTQSEVAKGVREELGGQISQSYLSQLESGARPHMTGPTRLLLARFFKVHPGYLVDDAEDMPALTMRPRRELDDKLDLWLIDGSQEFAEDARLSEALLQIAKHPKSRDCLVLFGSIVENRELIEKLIEKAGAAAPPARRKRKS
jgi:transcriptional regulator with XRE-family HTH domain